MAQTNIEMENGGGGGTWWRSNNAERTKGRKESSTPTQISSDMSTLTLCSRSFQRTAIPNNYEFTQRWTSVPPFLLHPPRLPRIFLKDGHLTGLETGPRTSSHHPSRQSIIKEESQGGHWLAGTCVQLGGWGREAHRCCAGEGEQVWLCVCSRWQCAYEFSCAHCKHTFM
jgi:hypothetical protein